MKYLSHNIFLFCHSIKVFEFYDEFAKKDEEHHSLIIYAYETPRFEIFELDIQKELTYSK